MLHWSGYNSCKLLDQKLGSKSGTIWGPRTVRTVPHRTYRTYRTRQHWRSAQPSPTQKGGIHAFFLNCTSEVIQWFLYVNVILLHKKQWVWGQGCEWGAGIVPFPARKVAWVQKCGFWSKYHQLLCYQIGQTISIKAKKRGLKICP